jgi:hypothetical protein
MGLSYKGGTPTHHSLRDNLSRLGRNPLFQRNGNHYGQAGKNGAAVTTIKSNNPLETAQEFFDKIGHGGMFLTDKRMGEVSFNRMKDGTIINFRVYSKSGSPAVDINIDNSSDNCGLRTHKIHFIK